MSSNKDPEERRATYRRFREKRKKWYWDFKATHPCTKCGESHPACIEFHHKEGHSHEVKISQMVSRHYSIKRILEAVAQCIILCANCHRKLHMAGSLNGKASGC